MRDRLLGQPDQRCDWLLQRCRRQSRRSGLLSGDHLRHPAAYLGDHHRHHSLNSPAWIPRRSRARLRPCRRPGGLSTWFCCLRRQEQCRASGGGGGRFGIADPFPFLFLISPLHGLGTPREALDNKLAREPTNGFLLGMSCLDLDYWSLMSLMLLFYVLNLAYLEWIMPRMGTPLPKSCLA